MRRHVDKFHGVANSQQRIEPPQEQPEAPVRLLHPFTMTISGPTSCGKTYLMKCVLTSTGLIQPAPERIVWLYKRWQPLYDEIQLMVRPRPEFVQGIPGNLDKDEFIDPKIRNLLVCDDLMSASSKDPRVTDLFTEGSHHRNLSVIAINQNLYYSKDPTQRRNCHYLVLFNNPIDQQPIMTLARQMYPGNPQTLMNKYREAVERRYGYLLIDLKPQTDAGMRLRPNGLEWARKKQLAQRELWSETDDSSDEDLVVARRVPPNKKGRQYACESCGALVSSLPHLIQHTKRVHWTR